MTVKARREKRVAQLKQMRAARTDAAGKPRDGYKNNVAAIDAEIASLTEEFNPDGDA